MSEGWRGWNRRLITVGAILVALAAGYVLLLRHFEVGQQPPGQSFGAARPTGDVLIRPIAVDAPGRTLQFGVYLTPGLADGGDDLVHADRDMILVVAHDGTETDVRLAASAPLVVSTLEIALADGSVNDYPLDSYRARLGFALLDGKTRAKIPLRVTVREGLMGFRLKAVSEPRPDVGIVDLAIAVDRSGAFAMFAFSAYAAMVVLASCALVVGFLTFGAVRKPEVTLIGSLVAMTFALPAFRNALPGAPPLGVAADLWVFLWAELAVVLALALIVYTWAKTGPPP